MNKERLLDVGQKVLLNGAIRGEYEGDVFWVVDTWDTLHKLWTELVHVAGAEGLYAKATAAAAAESRGGRIHTLLSGKEVPLITDQRISREGLFPYSGKGPYQVPEEVEELDEVYEEVLGSWGFSDEYSFCSCCGVILRTAPNSWSWLPDYYEDFESGELLCPNCVDVEKVLGACKNTCRHLPAFIDTQEGGLIELPQLYHNELFGRNDDPKIIIELLRQQDVDVWFSVYPEQFGVNFSLLVREEDEERAITALEGKEVN